MSTEMILFEKNEGVGTITMNREKKLNALLPEMIVELCDVLEEARRDHAVRSIVLRGAGRSFCAGDDLHPEERFKYGNPDLQTRLKVGYPRLVTEIVQMRKPVIAMVRGYAVGAGMDLALACDFRIAAPDTKMAAIFVKRGLGGGCAYLLPRYVGFGKATELLLLGEMVEADEALRLGLVTRVVEDAALEDETYAFARKMAKGPTSAYGAIKMARNQGLGCDPVKGVEWLTLAEAELMLHKDAREGPRAYLEKREPNFTGEWIDLQYDPVVPLTRKKD